jgi:non-heme chloroperoxidase
MDNDQRIKKYRVAGGGSIQLHVEETGNPKGRPLLFIHGFCQSQWVWRAQTKSYLANEFRIVTMDNRGHGLSDKPRDAYGDSKVWADDLQAVIDTLHLDSPILIGWSYGGLIIFDYLRHYGEGRISGVNLVGARSRIGILEAVEETGEDYISLRPSLLSNNFSEGVEASEKFIKLCTNRELSPEDFYFFLGFNVIVPPYVRDGLMSRSISNDDLLPTLQKPFLISHGVAERIVLPRHAQYNARLLKNSKLSLYEDVGHMPFQENNERFNRELKNFVNSLS